MPGLAGATWSWAAALWAAALLALIHTGASESNCTAVLAVLSDKLFIPSDSNLCGPLLQLPTDLQCSLINTLGTTLAGNTGLRCMQREPVALGPTTPSGAPMPAAMADRRPLPPRGFGANTRSEVLKNEGATMGWHYILIRNLYAAINCPAYTFPTPSGWDLLQTLTNAEPAGPLPLAVVLRQPAAAAVGGQLLVAVRGSQTPGDWATNFDYKTVSGNPLLAGATHSGFTRLAMMLWEQGVKAALDEQVLSGPLLGRVVITGHSLGAAIAQILSVAANTYLEQALARSGRSVIVDSLLYASPQAGDAAFVAAYNAKVNGRRPTFRFDLVPQMPCVAACNQGMPACTGGAVPTPSPNGADWNYVSAGGAITFDAAAMPVQRAAWGALGNINTCHPWDFVSATHSCSYACFFAKYMGLSDDTCLLWKDDGLARSRSYCRGFPVNTQGIPFPLPSLRGLVTGWLG